MRLKGMRLSGQQPDGMRLYGQRLIGMRPNRMWPDGMRLKGRGSRECGLLACGPTEWIPFNTPFKFKLFYSWNVNRIMYTYVLMSEINSLLLYFFHEVSILLLNVLFVVPRIQLIVKLKLTLERNLKRIATVMSQFVSNSVPK